MKGLHRLLFGRPGTVRIETIQHFDQLLLKAREFRSNLRNFAGFGFEDDSDEYDKKLKQLERCV